MSLAKGFLRVCYILWEYEALLSKLFHKILSRQRTLFAILKFLFHVWVFPTSLEVYSLRIKLKQSRNTTSKFPAVLDILYFSLDVRKLFGNEMEMNKMEYIFI